VGYDSSLNGNVSIGNDLIIGGRLSVRQYSSQNINLITTTMNNYQLIISEDLSLNGRMYFSGNVMIGRSGEPFYTLDVSSASTQPFRVGVGSNNAIVVDNNGRVGIGITNPAVSLDVVGSVKISSGLTLSTSLNANALTYYEEYEHTPNFTGGGGTTSNQSTITRVVRIGNMVTLMPKGGRWSIALTNNNSVPNSQNNLPARFAPNIDGNYLCRILENGSYVGSIYINTNGTMYAPLAVSSKGTEAYISGGGGTAFNMYFSITYYTSAAF
jgi:acetyltransferase-like isoleucine patch superfamily enzyme